MNRNIGLFLKCGALGSLEVPGAHTAKITDVPKQEESALRPLMATLGVSGVQGVSFWGVPLKKSGASVVWVPKTGR